MSKSCDFQPRRAVASFSEIFLWSWYAVLGMWIEGAFHDVMVFINVEVDYVLLNRPLVGNLIKNHKECSRMKARTVRYTRVVRAYKTWSTAAHGIASSATSSQTGETSAPNDEKGEAESARRRYRHCCKNRTHWRCSPWLHGTFSASRNCELAAHLCNEENESVEADTGEGEIENFLVICTMNT